MDSYYYEGLADEDLLRRWFKTVKAAAESPGFDLALFDETIGEPIIGACKFLTSDDHRTCEDLYFWRDNALQDNPFFHATYREALDFLSPTPAFVWDMINDWKTLFRIVTKDDDDGRFDIDQVDARDIGGFVISGSRLKLKVDSKLYPMSRKDAEIMSTTFAAHVQGMQTFCLILKSINCIDKEYAEAVAALERDVARFDYVTGGQEAFRTTAAMLGQGLPHLSHAELAALGDGAFATESCVDEDKGYGDIDSAKAFPVYNY